jgi:argininosuccinate lyase
VLWQKPGVKIDPRIHAFLAGDDVILDREFLPHDIEASRAHVEALLRIGMVFRGRIRRLDRELVALAGDVSAGDFVLDERFEDGH